MWSVATAAGRTVFSRAWRRIYVSVSTVTVTVTCQPTVSTLTNDFIRAPAVTWLPTTEHRLEHNHNTQRPLTCYFCCTNFRFCCAMLRISAAYAVMRCLSVCLSVCRVRVFCRNEWTYVQFFSPSGSQTILVFPCPTLWQHSRNFQSRRAITVLWVHLIKFARWQHPAMWELSEVCCALHHLLKINLFTIFYPLMGCLKQA